MEDFTNSLRNKSIHIVGVTGAEGSSILRFLVKHNISNITAHDFSAANIFEKSFKLWHRGIDVLERDKLYQQFQKDLKLVKLNCGRDYLKDIESAGVVFVPQSWRLYKRENALLSRIADKIPFYSLTRLYLDFAKAKVVAVTGTVGKGSTANIIFQLLKLNNRRAYFAGNETWMLQIADKLDEMTTDDILILEISHRQVLDGFSRAPHLVVVTNLYPNHLDEVSWNDYVNLKLALVRQQKQADMAVLNFDTRELRLAGQLKSKVVYFSEKTITVNTKSIQKIRTKLSNIKSVHYLPNLLAGMTAAELLGLDPEKLLGQLQKITPLPARLELVKSINGIDIYDDIKSTTPWATLVAIKKLEKNTILICGGRTKGIDYKDFTDRLKQHVKFVIALKSELNDELVKLLSDNTYQEVYNLNEALELAFKHAGKGDNILISPAAGFFYSDFIKGKKSIRRLVQELSPTGS